MTGWIKLFFVTIILLLIASGLLNCILLTKRGECSDTQQFGLYTVDGKLNLFLVIDNDGKWIDFECDPTDNHIVNISAYNHNVKNGLTVSNYDGEISELCIYRDGRPYLGFTTDFSSNPQKVRYYEHWECIDEKGVALLGKQANDVHERLLRRPLDIMFGRRTVKHVAIDNDAIK